MAEDRACKVPPDSPPRADGVAELPRPANRTHQPSLAGPESPPSHDFLALHTPTVAARPGQSANGFHKDLELLSTTMTVRLGSMLVVGFGVMIAALKFLQS
jgi:hypothetical protein